MTAIIRGHDVGCVAEEKQARRLIVAIDGPAGVGKSTVAQLLASRLGYLYLDTGALYRAMAWAVIESGRDPADVEAVAALLPTLSLKMQFHHGAATVLVNGRDVSGDLRTPAVSAAASVVSAIPAVRAWLLPIQRQIGQGGAVVAEGRDMGTSVFPSADVKFFSKRIRLSGRNADIGNSLRRDIPGHLKRRQPTWRDAIHEIVPVRSPRWFLLRMPGSLTPQRCPSRRWWTR